MPEAVHKKVKRGKRGGKKVKDREAGAPVEDMNQEASVVTSQPDIDAPSVTATYEPALHSDRAPPGATSTGEPQKKKTRRGGQRGKAKAEVAEGATGVNAVAVGSGRTAAEEAAWETWDHDRSKDVEYTNRPPQPFFGVMAPDDHQYFLSMEKELDTKEFESEEEKALFIGAMFRAMDGKECIVAADPDCSRVVEKMLRSADDFRVRVFTDRLNGQFIELFKHQFASHVCQTLIYAAADVVDREIKGTFVVEAPEGDEAALETLPTMTTLVEQLCEQMKGEWKDLMMDAYASHLVRAVLCLLSGDPLAQGEAERRSKKSKKYNSEHNNTWKPNPANAPKTGRAGVSVKRTVPPQFKEALKEITREVAEQMEIMGLRTYATHIVANPVLQLLISLSDTSESLISTLLAVEDSATCQLSTQTDEERQFMVDLIRHPVGSHLVEKLLAAASAHLFHQLYVTYFRGQLEELCLHPVANFVVQQLICHTRNGTQLEVLLDELIPFFPTLFTHRRPGVVVKVAEACVKHQTGKCQKEVVKAVANALKATAPEQRKQLVNLILCLKPYGALGEAAKADTNGSLILQNLLLFDEDANKMVIDSFMSLTPEESRNWAFSPTSSRVLEQFLLSSTINLKAKRKLIRSWLGKFATLAADKFGSHTVDKAWAVADIGLKEKIAEDLYNHTKTLQNSHFGKFVLRNCKIETYGKRREEWVERQMGHERKRDMFKEFLDDDDAGKRAASNDESGKKAKKAKEQADPLWTTHQFDAGMAALGFTGGRVGDAGVVLPGKKEKIVKGDKKDKKSKKSKATGAAKEYEEIEKLALSDNEDAPTSTDPTADAVITSAITKESKDEIENLFQKSKKRKRADGHHTFNSDAEEESNDDSDGDDATLAAVDVVATPQSKKLKKDRDIVSVLEAISATKKRKKGKSGEKEEKKEKKEKEGRKRKFEG